MFQKEDFNAFEQTLHDALKMAHDLKSYNGLTYVYDILANGAFMKKDYVNAEKLFVTVIQRLTFKGGQENDLNILHICLKLAKIYEAQKDFMCVLIMFTSFVFKLFMIKFKLLFIIKIPYFNQILKYNFVY